MATLTMKFGGLSVGTSTALTQVISIILHEYEQWDHLIVVVSALEGVTDSLLEATQLAWLANRRGYRRIVATIRTRHLSLIEKLPLSPSEQGALQANIDQLLFEMLDQCQTIADSTHDTLTPDMFDPIIGIGERLAARIVAALLRENDLRGVAIDTTDLIITDAIFGNATPNIPDTRARIQSQLMPMLERKIVPVLTGFIGRTRTGKPTTMGRGGSDYTASIIAVCTETDEVWMWTDVDGLMSSDPREVPTAQVIDQMTYNEVAELAYFGARILHSRMILPLREHNIPLRIKNVFKPQQIGTLIHSTNTDKAHRIKAVTAIQGIGLYSERSSSIGELAILVDREIADIIGTEAEVTITAQSSSESFVCFVIPTSAGPDAVLATQTAVENALQEHPQLGRWQVSPVSIITAIGSGLTLRPQIVATIFQVLDDIAIRALSQGPSHCNLSFVMKPSDADEALHRIHALIISSDPGNGQAPNP